MLLLVGSRPHRGGATALWLEPGAQVLRPTPLSRDEVQRWLADRLGAEVDESFATACHQAAGGNPFLIGELVREIDAESIPPTAAGAGTVRGLSPEGVMTAVLLRLGGLSPEAGALARATAVLGEGELRLVAELAGLGEPAGVAAVAELVRAGVLEPAETVSFVHPLVRTVLYEDRAPAERAAEHGRAARLLHAGGVDAERVAAQLILSAPVGEPWALEALVTVAARASRNGAPEVGARYLARAVSETRAGDERFEVTLALGTAATLAERPGAIDHLREAQRLARTPSQHARGAIKLARALRYAGAGEEAVALLEAAGEHVGAEEAELAARVEHELLAASTVSFAARERMSARRAAWRAAAQRTPESLFDRLVVAAEAVDAAGRGDPAAGVAALAEAPLAQAARRDHLGRHLRLLVAYAFWGIDALDRYDGLIELILADAREGGGAELTAVGLAQRALGNYRRGRLPDVEADAVAALEFAAELPAPPAFLLTAGASLLIAAAERGTPPHPLAVALSDDRDSFFARHLQHARASLDVAQGRVADGLAGLLALGERERAVGWTGPAYFPWRSQAALVLAELGEQAEAERLAGEELVLGERLGTARARGVALHAVALVTAEGRILRLTEASELLARSNAELEHARSLVDLGAALRRAREPARARDPLRRGHDLALTLGATLLAERAHQELLAAGARPRRTTLTGAGSLTPSERRVVDLAAEGLTNREIAQRLYVTEKTVEAHLGRAYAKLDIHSRRGLAGALAADAEPSSATTP